MREPKTRGSGAERTPTICVAEPHPSLARLHARAHELGWRCHETEWASNKANYTFECAQGHRFERAAQSLDRGNPQCLECKVDELRTRWLAMVAERGGTQLRTFTGTKKRYRMRCARGHEWGYGETRSVRAVGVPSVSIGIMRNLCARPTVWRDCRQPSQRKADAVLRKDYAGGSALYLFECAKGHQWKARGARVVQGTWCAQCSR